MASAGSDDRANTADEFDRALAAAWVDYARALKGEARSDELSLPDPVTTRWFWWFKVRVVMMLFTMRPSAQTRSVPDELWSASYAVEEVCRSSAVHGSAVIRAIERNPRFEAPLRSELASGPVSGLYEHHGAIVLAPGPEPPRMPLDGRNTLEHLVLALLSERKWDGELGDPLTQAAIAADHVLGAPVPIALDLLSAVAAHPSARQGSMAGDQFCEAMSEFLSAHGRRGAIAYLERSRTDWSLSTFWSEGADARGEGVFFDQARRDFDWLLEQLDAGA